MMISKRCHVRHIMEPHQRQHIKSWTREPKKFMPVNSVHLVIWSNLWSRLQGPFVQRGYFSLYKGASKASHENHFTSTIKFNLKINLHNLMLMSCVTIKYFAVLRFSVQFQQISFQSVLLNTGCTCVECQFVRVWRS